MPSLCRREAKWHTLSARQNGRFVNRPYGTPHRPTIFHVAEGNISRRHRRYFTKASLLFHVALQHFTALPAPSAAFHKITDFISRCRGATFHRGISCRLRQSFCIM